MLCLQGQALFLKKEEGRDDGTDHAPPPQFANSESTAVSRPPTLGKGDDDAVLRSLSGEPTVPRLRVSLRLAA
jgi:hypothetical protein